LAEQGETRTGIGIIREYIPAVKFCPSAHGKTPLPVRLLVVERKVADFDIF